MNTNAQVMAWMMDEYGKLHGHTPAFVTGKPIALGGSYGREAATGRGFVYCSARRRPTLGLPAEGARRASRASATSAAGRRGSSQSSAARWSASPTRTARSHSENGIDAEALTEHMREGGKVERVRRRSRRSSPEELLALECEVLIPAALGGMIHADNADRMNARMVVEGANSPTTPKADEILSDKGVLVIPDVLANAGGVVVSYFEWVQNLQHFRWDEHEVNDKLGRSCAAPTARCRARRGGRRAAAGRRLPDRHRARRRRGEDARLHLLNSESAGPRTDVTRPGARKPAAAKARPGAGGIAPRMRPEASRRVVSEAGRPVLPSGGPAGLS